MTAVYRVTQDGHYSFLRIAEQDYEDWTAHMLFEEAVRGVPLTSQWNEQWDFVAMEDDSVEEPKSVGDFAEMNRLITATNERGLNVLRPLLPDAEVLGGNYNGNRVTFFNVLHRVHRREISQLNVEAVFRVNPVALNVFCLAGFKGAIERSGLRGLAFERVNLDDEFGLV